MLKNIGITIYNEKGEIKQSGQIFDELVEKWSLLDEKEKDYVMKVMLYS